MNVRGLVVIALVGCGRIHFDEGSREDDARIDDTAIDVTVMSELLAYYPLDESSFLGGATDASGNGHTAQCSPCPTSAPGRVGGSAQLNGNSQYFSVPWRPALDTPAAFTIAAWISPAVTNVAMLVVGRPWGTLQTNTYALFMPGTGFIELTTLDSTGDTLTQAGPLTAQVWQHVAGTWDGAMQRLYINGIERGASPTSEVLFEPRPLLIGVDEDNGAHTWYFSGLLDEVRLYDRALSPAEILQIATP